MKISPYQLYDAGVLERGYRFYCPGCRALHAIRTEGALGRPLWQFNGNYEAPTFQPSVHCTHHRGHWADTEHDGSDEVWVPYGEPVTDCHLFITSGTLKYLDDCPHEFRGETIPMVEFPTTQQDFDRLADAPRSAFRT